MKVLVISDIHGSGYYAEKIKEINEKEKPEKIILLGDLYYHGPRNNLSQEYNPMKVAEILNSLKDKLLVVKGNCDAEVDEMISEFEFKDHILMEPNSVAPIIVIGTTSLGSYIVSEATLSFLGIGLPPSVVSWGGDISKAQTVLRTDPMVLFYPSLALAITVLAFIMMGDAVKDALDPKSRTA